MWAARCIPVATAWAAQAAWATQRHAAWAAVAGPVALRAPTHPDQWDLITLTPHITPAPRITRTTPTTPERPGRHPHPGNPDPHPLNWWTTSIWIQRLTW